MELKNKKILLISPEPWDHIFVSKHHYAVHLAKNGNKVFFLNPPGNKKSLEITDYSNVYSVQYCGFLKGLRFFPAFILRSQTKKVFAELERICKIKFDIIWSFDNSVFYDFGALPDHVQKISHIVDLNQNFQLKKAATSADVCFGSSKSIINKLKKYNNRSFFIHHGLNLSVESKWISFDKIHKVKVGYAGNLDSKYIDWEVIRRCICDNNSVQFYFAGPSSAGNQNAVWLGQQTNVSLLGKLEPSQMLAFYNQMDLLFLSYRADDFSEQLANPHKMMEYLASGKMICTTYTEEYRLLQKEKLIVMVQKNQTFPKLFKKVLFNLRSWNTRQKQHARRIFAYENTYQKQLDRIEAILNHVR